MKDICPISLSRSPTDYELSKAATTLLRRKRLRFIIAELATLASSFDSAPTHLYTTLPWMPPAQHLHNNRFPPIAYGINRRWRPEGRRYPASDCRRPLWDQAGVITATTTSTTPTTREVVRGSASSTSTLVQARTSAMASNNGAVVAMVRAKQRNLWWEDASAVRGRGYGGFAVQNESVSVRVISCRSTVVDQFSSRKPQRWGKQWGWKKAFGAAALGKKMEKGRGRGEAAGRSGLAGAVDPFRGMWRWSRRQSLACSRARVHESGGEGRD
uniref:Uncharacterized protein n=1 Tax=Oryza sativa subsp. japonica TaxID=39947 RepID=Q75L74_ORYSJ|nr:hypothetical protein [Oryza sativa Japonica Group]